MSFHQWLGADEDGEDTCTGCGVTTPDFGEGWVSDHSPLPLFCEPDDWSPWARDGQAHHFTGTREEITCERCGYTITDNTMPNEVRWACKEI